MFLTLMPYVIYLAVGSVLLEQMKEHEFGSSLLLLAVSVFGMLMIWLSHMILKFDYPMDKAVTWSVMVSIFAFLWALVNASV